MYTYFLMIGIGFSMLLIVIGLYYTISFFVKIEVYGKNVRFLNISENTKENLIIFRTDFTFAFISRHFFGLVQHFTGRTELYHRQKTCVEKVQEIQLRIRENKCIAKS